LGPGESGKSTIFKQLKILQDDGGFTHEELERYKGLIFYNCISQMRTLVESAVALATPLEKRESIENAQTLLKLSRDPVWNRELGMVIKNLWSDTGIRETFRQKGTSFVLNDTAEYFFDNIDRFLADDYFPKTEDVLRVRVRSTGVEESKFTFDRRLFTFVDVGGQKAERRKWVHCFDNVTAVVFCASLSDYDLTLREDPRVNRMVDSLQLFAEVVNSQVFAGRGFILFLNKTDLFEVKLAHSPLKAVFEDFNDGRDYDKACHFVKQKFLDKIKARDLSGVFTHFTCALDTKNMAFVVRALRVKLLDDKFNEFVV